MPIYSLTSATQTPNTSVNQNVRPEIIDIYEFTLGSDEHNAANYTIPNWTERIGAGYVIGNSSMILDFDNNNTWLCPGDYMASSHPTLGVRYTIYNNAIIGTWQVGTEARGKKARFSITWIKQTDIL